MATPNYKGQELARGEVGRSLGSLLGGDAPAYAGAGQPGSKSGFLGGSSPAYKPAPTARATTGATDGDLSEPEGFAIVIPRQVMNQ